MACLTRGRWVGAAWLQRRGTCPGIPSHRHLAPYPLARLAEAAPQLRWASSSDSSSPAAAAAAAGRAQSPTPAPAPADRATDERFMRLALEQAGAAAAADEVPVGAVLVSPAGEVLAAAHNATERDGDPTAHAELLCIRGAAAAAGGWRLLDATLYVTLEPCPMCAGALLQSRVGAVVYGARNTLLGADGSWIAMLPRPPNEEAGGGDDGVGSRASSSSDSSPSSSPSGGESSSSSNRSEAAQASAAPAQAEAEAAAPARPHPFHPNLRVRRGVLAEECAALMRSFFARRRREAAEAAAAAQGAAAPATD